MLRIRSGGKCQRESCRAPGCLGPLTHQVWCDLDKTVPMYGGTMEEVSEPAPPHPVTAQSTTEHVATNTSVC